MSEKIEVFQTREYTLDSGKTVTGVSTKDSQYESSVKVRDLVVENGRISCKLDVVYGTRQKKLGTVSTLSYTKDGNPRLGKDGKHAMDVESIYKYAAVITGTRDVDANLEEFLCWIESLMETKDDKGFNSKGDVILHVNDKRFVKTSKQALDPVYESTKLWLEAAGVTRYGITDEKPEGEGDITARWLAKNYGTNEKVTKAVDAQRKRMEKAAGSVEVF